MIKINIHVYILIVKNFKFRINCSKLHCLNNCLHFGLNLVKLKRLFYILK